MSAPFTSGRVVRFLLLCALALVGVWLLFLMLTHARPRKGVQPQGQQSYISVPGPARVERSASFAV